MYIVGVLTQILNFIQSLWTNKKWRVTIIYSILFVVIFMYSTRTLNSMIRRDQITLPTIAEDFIAFMYAEQNKLYAERMKARAAQQQAQQGQQGQQGQQAQQGDRQGQPSQMQGQQGQQQQQVQQATNKGGRKTSYDPVTAFVIIMQLLAMSAICCTIIFLAYRRFMVDSVPPLPILSTKGKLNE